MAVLAPLALAVGPTLASMGLEAAATAGVFGAGSAAFSAFEMADTIGALSSTIGTVESLVGTGIQALGARNAGISANQEANYRAKQATIQAGQERASSQRARIEQIRQLRLVQSRGQAIAAASGAGALDPSVMDIMGDLETEGQYKAAVAGFQGEDSARNLESQAMLDRFSGREAKSAGNIKSISTLMSGASDLFTKYDGGHYG